MIKQALKKVVGAIIVIYGAIMLLYGVPSTQFTGEIDPFAFLGGLFISMLVLYIGWRIWQWGSTEPELEPV